MKREGKDEGNKVGIEGGKQQKGGFAEMEERKEQNSGKLSCWRNWLKNVLTAELGAMK